MSRTIAKVEGKKREVIVTSYSGGVHGSCIQMTQWTSGTISDADVIQLDKEMVRQLRDSLNIWLAERS